MQKALKILFQNRDPESWIGGDMFHMERTKEALEALGHEITFSPDPYIDPQPFDIVHLWNITTPWTYAQYLNAKLAGKPVVITAIYIPNKLMAGSNVKEMLNGAEAVIFSTKREKKVIEEEYHDKNSHIIPLGLDWDVLDEVPEKKRVVLYVGRLEASKNLFLLALACKKLDVPMLIAGEEVDPSYADVCRRVDYNKAFFAGPVKREELKRYYESCEIYVQPSKYETWSLTTMEALSRGCKVVYTKNGNAFREFKSVEFCDPFNYNSIADAIEKQLKGKFSPADFDLLKTMSWDAAAAKIGAIYENIHNHSYDRKD